MSENDNPPGGMSCIVEGEAAEGGFQERQPLHFCWQGHVQSFHLRVCRQPLSSSPELDSAGRPDSLVLISGFHCDLRCIFLPPS